MQHPELSGHGDPGNFASKTPSNNISYELVERINQAMGARFNAMTFNVTGCREYQQTDTQDGSYTVIDPEIVLKATDINASPMAFEGKATGGNDTAGADVPKPYLIAPAYASFLAACASGDMTQLKAWHDTHFSPTSNWQDFINGLGINQAIANFEKQAIIQAGEGLPSL